MKEKINLALTASLLLILMTVCFGFNSSVLDIRAQQALDGVVTQLDSLSDYTIHLSGHTDNIGSDSYNEKLSEKRAIAVRDYLISKHVDSTKITICYAGEGEPIVPNVSEENRALNRRVEVTIGGERIETTQPEIPKQKAAILEQEVNETISPIQKEVKITSSEVRKKKKVKRRLVWTGWRTGFHWSTSGK